jgi:hypothetical protein
MDKVREAGAAETGMKPKETLLRVDGEVVRGESAIVLVDPRRVGGFKKWPFRIELYEVKYEVLSIILFTTTSTTHWVLAVRQEFYCPPSPYVSLGYQRLIIDIKGTDTETLFRTRTDPCARASNRQGYW